MAVRAVVVCVAAVGHALVVGPCGAVGVDGFGAVGHLAGRALGAVGLETAACLGADADAVAEFDVGDVGADADGFADDFVADAADCMAGWLVMGW